MLLFTGSDRFRAVETKQKANNQIMGTRHPELLLGGLDDDWDCERKKGRKR